MVDVSLENNEELRNRDLSRRPVAQLSREEKLELKRRFEEFVTVLRRDHSGPKTRKASAPKAVKWDPKRHGGTSAALISKS